METRGWRPSRRGIVIGTAVLGAGLVVGTILDKLIGQPDAAFVLDAIGWDATRFPVGVRRTDAGWSTDFNRNAYLPDDAFPLTFYVDIARPNNDGDGTTPATAKRSIHTAIAAANRVGRPARILIETEHGPYNRGDGFSNSGAVIPMQDIAIIPAHDGLPGEGRIVSGPFDRLGWSGATDPVYTNCCTTTRRDVARVFDVTQVDGFGNYREIGEENSAEAVNDGGGWFVDAAGTLYVRRHDDAVVTNENTRVFLNAANFKLTAQSGKLYLRNVDFEGGSAGDQNPFAVSGCLDTIVIAENCSFKYGGSSARLRDGALISGSSGLFAFIGCVSAANTKDGLNAAWSVDPERRLFMLTENCECFDNGRFGSASSNGLTGHGSSVHLDVNGNYHDDHGGEVRFIDTCRSAHFGTRAAFDQGDGGQTMTVGFNTSNAARMWLWDCTGEMLSPDDYSLYASSTNSPIRVRNYRDITGKVGTKGISSF